MIWLLCAQQAFLASHSHGRHLLFKRLGNDKVKILKDAAEVGAQAGLGLPAPIKDKGGNALYSWPDRVKPSPRRDYKQKDCQKRGWGWEPLIDNMDIWLGAKKGTPRIMCMVYTMKGTGGVHNKPRGPQQIGQNSTWAPHCDKFLFFTDKDLGKDLPHEVIKPLKGPEAYSNMWQKVRAMWKRAYKQQKAGEWDFDYFTINGDDLYMIVDNLRRFLTRPDIAKAHAEGKPLYMGRRFDMGGGQVFNTGGGSYILNNAALSKYGEHMNEASCNPDASTHAEDVMMAKCLQSLNVAPYDTRETDERSKYFHSEHFHPLSADAHYIYTKGSWGPNGWYDKYTAPYDLQYGLKCCSPNSVSYHYIDEGTMQFMHKFLYECRGMVDPYTKK